MSADGHVGVRLQVPASTKSFSIVRLVGTSFGRQLELAHEDVEDLRLALSEACIYVLRSGSDTRAIEISLAAKARGLEVSVDPIGPMTDAPPSAHAGLRRSADASAGEDGDGTPTGWSLDVLRAMTDGIVLKRSSVGVSVRFVIGRGGAES
jgi:anti-sigma regulatory factor (Ser/Thr protein kinase)